jgi:hypothetical protein
VSPPHIQAQFNATPTLSANECNLTGQWMKSLKILLLTGLLLLSVGIATAQEAAVVEVSPELLTQLEAIENIAMEVRGLEMLVPLNRVFPSRADVEIFLQSSIDEQLTPELVEESVAFYYLFDFAPRDIDLVETYLALIEDQIGGYYNPEDESLNTILITGDELGDRLPVLEQVIYAHEFVHALQDQHFDLAALGFAPEEIDDVDVDQFLARQALVEGDATFVMNVYTEFLISENPFAAIGLLGASVGSSGAIPQGTPPILMRELLFPYNSGLTFVTALVNDGGYRAVDNAFLELPVSTEQILHPQRYLAGEMPQPVSLGEETAVALGTEWAEISQNTLGEFYLRAYIDNEISRLDWLEATTGWGGDRYAMYEGANGELAMLARLAWDTPTDSDEFAAIYEQYGMARFGVASVDGCWADDESAICFIVLANGDTVISRAPSQAGAQALIATQQ